MASEASLTLAEAAEVLGVSQNATAAEVNASYRKLVSKYHPDANRNKSEAEQKKAEELFKKVGVARKVLLNPELAKQEQAFSVPSTSTSSSTHQRTSSSSASSNRSSSNSSSQSWSGNSRTQSNGGYNRSTSVHDNIPKVPDPAESTLHEMYKNEIRGEYVSFSDNVRLTPSLGVSIVFLVIAIASLLMDPRGLSALSIENPNLIMALIALVKCVYDLFFSFHVHQLLAKYSIGWTSQTAVGAAFMSIVYIIIVNVFKDFTPKAATPLPTPIQQQPIDPTAPIDNIAAAPSNALSGAYLPDFFYPAMILLIIAGIAACALDIAFLRPRREEAKSGNKSKKKSS